MKVKSPTDNHKNATKRGGAAWVLFSQGPIHTAKGVKKKIFLGGNLKGGVAVKENSENLKFLVKVAFVGGELEERSLGFSHVFQQIKKSTTPPKDLGTLKKKKRS